MKAGSSHYADPTSRQHPSQVRTSPLRLPVSSAALLLQLLGNIIGQPLYLKLKGPT